MLDKKMDGYVTRAEDQAYEIGVSVGKSKERRRLMEHYIDELKDEAEEYAEFVRNHWSQDLMVKPEALVAVIETRISRAVLYERRRIIGLIDELKSESDGREGLDDYVDGRCDALKECIALINGGE
jgi:hypothetical protein